MLARRGDGGMRLSEALDLRDYQLRALDQLRTKLRAGARRLVLIMPTGGGKTVVASAMVKAAITKGSRIVFIAHRRELIDQTVDKLSRFGVPAGVIMAADRRRDDYLPAQVASIQTLARRLDKLPRASLIILDECHHACSDSYRKVLAGYSDATVIGLTATPWRSDKIGLADTFQDSVLAATPVELIAAGALVQYEAFAYDSPKLHKVRTIAGEYHQGDLASACNTKVLVGSAVREYLKHTPGKRAIVFPVNIAHSQALVAEFRAAGVNAEHLDCKTPASERLRMIEGLRSGAVTVLSSVGVLTEGFDAPAAEVCILVRPTKSAGLHLQMIGRVLRPHPGKSQAIIHDHSGNLFRHGLPDDERDYSLTATPNRIRDLHTCPLCNAVFGSLRPDGTCPKCSEIIAPPREAALGVTVREEHEVVDGERLSKEELRARKQQKNAQAPRTEQCAEYLRLKTIAETKGYKPGWVGVRFKATFGTWPHFTKEELAATKPARIPFSKRAA